MRAALVLLLASSTASAQPVTSPDVCRVDIVRAPPEVAGVIQTWVRAEARCGATLEVRVLPVEGGLYLLARYPDGRIRERVVPDAQAAGVLVASWSAEATVIAPPAPLPPPAPMPPPAPPTVDPFAAGVTATAPAPQPKLASWGFASLAARAADGGGGGVRAELDILTRGRWAIGAAVLASEATIYGPWSTITSNDIRLAVYAARTKTMGRWLLRAGLGVGVTISEAGAYDWGYNGSWNDEYMTQEGAAPTLEGQLMLVRRLGDTWSIQAGANLGVTAQEYVMSSGSFERPAELMLLGGIGHTL